MAALAALHEGYSYPITAEREHESKGWSQYHVAISKVSDLVGKTQAEGCSTIAAEEEILIACAMFAAIEMLFGDVKAAAKHIRSGMSLLHWFINRRHEAHLVSPTTADGLNTITERCSDVSRTHSKRSFLDGHLPDLTGFLVVLDVQLMSFPSLADHELPERADHGVSPAMSGRQIYSFTDLPTKLYCITSEALHWCRNQAFPLKYAESKPSALYESQMHLVAHLVAWCSTYSSTDSTEASLESVNLLITYHLAIMRVHTALSNHENIYSDTVCMDSFREILRFATSILQPSKSECPASRRLSLDTNTIEAVYHVAIKCRDETLRLHALNLLRCAGREGVWDGMAMAVVAEHVISLEERQHDCDGETTALVNEVDFEVDRHARTVKVACGWFETQHRTWRRQGRMLTW